MTPEERFTRIETVLETLAGAVIARDNQLDHLTEVVNVLAVSSQRHDAAFNAIAVELKEITANISSLGKTSQQHEAEIAALRELHADLTRQWQAYLMRRPKQ